MTLSERIAREVREHPPVNGCTIAGAHRCILSVMRRQDVPPIVSPWVEIALNGRLPAKEFGR